MKNKISLKKLELKINKINDLKTTKIKGGFRTANTKYVCPPPTITGP